MKRIINIVIVLLILAGCKTMKPELKKRTEADQERIAALELQIEHLNRQIKEIEADKTDQANEIGRLHDTIQSLKNYLDEKQNQIIQLKDELVSKENTRINLIEKMEKSKPFKLTCDDIVDTNDFILNLYKVREKNIILDNLCEDFFKNLFEEDDFEKNFPVTLYYTMSINNNMIEIRETGSSNIEANFQYTTSEEKFNTHQKDIKDNRLTFIDSLEIVNPLKTFKAYLIPDQNQFNIDLRNDNIRNLEFDNSLYSIAWDIQPNGFKKDTVLTLSLSLEGAKGEYLPVGDTKTELNIKHYAPHIPLFDWKPINANTVLAICLSLFSGLFIERYKHKLKFGQTSDE